VNKKSRVYFFSLTLDNLGPDQLKERYTKLLDHPNTSYVMFIGTYEFIYSIFSKSYRKVLEDSSLVLCTSKALALMYQYLFHYQINVYNEFKIVKKMLSYTNQNKGTIIIAGGKPVEYKYISRKLKNYYQNLKIYQIGQVFLKDYKKISYITAKIQPEILFLGYSSREFRKKIYSNKNKIASRIFFYSKKSFRIFSDLEREKNANIFVHYFYKSLKFIRNPFRFLFFLRYIFYFIFLFFYKLYIILR